MSSIFKTQMAKEKSSWMFVFMTGFIVGVLFINFWDKSEMAQEGLVSIDTLQRLKYFQIDSSKFLGYVLEERLKTVFILTLLATTMIGILASYVYIGWLGISMGILLAVMTLRFGIKGTVLFGCCVFPQYLIYIPASILFVNWCVRICKKIHFKHLDFESTYGSKKQQILQAGIQLFAIIGVVIIGCLVECYVNPLFLNEIVKIF